MPTLEEFWKIARSEMCGFVVGSSAWEQVPPTEQRDAVHRICEHSTFLFVRVSLFGLTPATAQAFAKDAAAARCGPLDAKRFCYGQDCDITLADIPVLLSIAQLQEKAGSASFYPLGLSESDTSLLRLIATDRHASADPLAIHRIGTRDLAGGKSAARVFHLSDGRSHPFIAKVDKVKELHAELDRYQRWIQSWEPNGTSPTFYTHQGSAAIAYRLQAAPDGNGEPAPTLEEFLERVRAMEWTESLEATRLKASDVLQGVGRAVDRLAELNSRFSGGAQGDDFSLDWPVRSLAERGIETTVLNQGWETLALSSVTKKAMSRLGPNLSRGVIHGDIHGRNILLLDRTPAFIDFRWSGPGHPLVDLVRLDATVRTIAMRMSLPKQSMFQAFESIYVDGQPADQVLADHSTLAKSPLTSLAIGVAARVRKAAIEVAKVHSMDVVDFWAMSCIVAGHVLAVRNPGSAVERLLLGVLAPRL